MNLKNIINSKTIQKVLGDRKGFWKYSPWKCNSCKRTLWILQDGVVKPKKCICGNKNLKKGKNLYFPKEKTPYLVIVEKGEPKNG